MDIVQEKNKNRHDERFKQLGLNIAFYRKLKGLTQLQLAEMIGISRTHMSNIEAPQMATTVSMEVLFDIANALEVEPGKLLLMRE